MTDAVDAAELEILAVGGADEQRAAEEQARTEFDGWYWSTRMRAGRYSAARGPQAFRAYLSLAAIALNTACCATAHREEDPAADAGHRWVAEAGIAPLHAELAQAANDLLRLLEKELGRVGPDGAVRP